MKEQRRIFPFVQMDVFTAQPLEGNPLAVFPDARGLSDAEMQALAREMNLSETTFVFPREAEVEQKHGVRVRIFTVTEELPFAGHPTLGTAMVLRSRLRGESAKPRADENTSVLDEIWLDLNVGKIPVRFSRDASGRLFGEMQQRDPEFLGRHSPEDVARATGLPLADIDSELPIETISTGAAFTILAIKSLRTLQGVQFDCRKAAQYLERSGGRSFYLVCRETVHAESRLHARMIFYQGEDPATGSAAGCAAAWMVAHGVARPGEAAIIEQGLEIGRPSRIVVRAEREGDRIVNVRVGGNAVQVLRGEVSL
jgi:trans-2,3-dihydro-3-hydroxyanthranilate isomerase